MALNSTGPTGDTKELGKITADAFEIQVAVAGAGLLRHILGIYLWPAPMEPTQLSFCSLFSLR
jgi:hypothetical protein